MSSCQSRTTTPTTAAPARSPVPMRAARIKRSLPDEAAEAPFAGRVGPDRLVEVLAAELRPEHVGHPELRVGDLPEEEVRDAELPRRADAEVHVAHRRVVEARRERRLVDVL